jgi:hypothetical protein
VVGLLAEAVAFGLWAIGRRTASVGVVARTGGLVFYWIHRVGLVFDVGSSAPAGRSATTVTVAFAPLLGTAVACSLLYLGGRAVGRSVGLGRTIDALQGLKVAVPYAALCWVGAFGARVSAVPLPAAALPVRIASVRPAMLAALLWPLLLAAVFAGAGALLSRPRRDRAPGADDERAEDGMSVPAARAVTAGALAMLLVSLVLAFAGLLILAAAKPSTTRAYFRGAFDRGTTRGVALLGLQAMVAPNIAAWVLAPSMGGCDAVTVSPSPGRGCFLSFSRFPTGRGALGAVGLGGLGAGAATGATAPGERGVPAGYYLFVLAPVLAVLAGGHRTVRDGPPSRGRAAFLGAAAGVAFAALSALLYAAAQIVATLKGTAGASNGTLPGSFSAVIGPRVWMGALLGLAWGAIGGAAGAVLLRPHDRA